MIDRQFLRHIDLTDPIRAERELRRVLTSIYSYVDSLTVASDTGVPVAEVIRQTSPGSGSGASPTPSGLRSSSSNITTNNNSMDAIKNALELNGQAEMSVTGLRGALYSPQRARVDQFTNNLPPTSQAIVDGQLGFLDGSLYLFKQGAPGSWLPITGTASSATEFSADLLVNRPNPHPGNLFYAEDTRILYYGDTSIGGQQRWSYLSGIHSEPLLANKPTPTSYQTGYLFHAQDYDHVWRWTGSGWEWAPGEQGSGFFRMFAETPTTGKWYSLTGGSVLVSTSTAGTTSVTTPNLWGDPRVPHLTSYYTSSLTLPDIYDAGIDSAPAGPTNFDNAGTSEPYPDSVTTDWTGQTSEPSLGVQVAPGSGSWVPYVLHTHSAVHNHNFAHYHDTTHFHNITTHHYHPAGERIDVTDLPVVHMLTFLRG